MSNLTEKVPKGTDHINELIINDGDQATAFVTNGVTKIELTLNGQTYSHDNGRIEWLNHKLRFRLTDLNLTGLHQATLVVFDGERPNGQPLFDEATDQTLCFYFY